MKNPKITSKQLEILEIKFCEFLQDVKIQFDLIRPTHSRSGGGLLKMELIIDQDGVRLEEPNRSEPFFLGDSNRSFVLEWGDEALDNTVETTQKLCQNISTKRIRKTLRGLMLEMFKDQNLGKEIDLEVQSIAEILDLSDLKKKLRKTIQWLRKNTTTQIVFVPIEGLDLRVHQFTIGNVMGV